MAATPERGALIGPATYAEIKRTIERVNGMPADAAGLTRIPTDFSGDTTYVAPTFRIATFTGAWSINQTKTVTLVSNTATTVVATNVFANLAAASGSRNCGIARDGATWYLIAAQC